MLCLCKTAAKAAPLFIKAVKQACHDSNILIFRQQPAKLTACGVQQLQLTCRVSRRGQEDAASCTKRPSPNLPLTAKSFRSGCPLGRVGDVRPDTGQLAAMP